MEQIYEWDERKSQINFLKHKVSFEEAQTIFDDPLLVTFSDEVHSAKEDRLISIGISKKERLLLVVYVEKLETKKFTLIRIISCRKATAHERKIYEESK